MQKKTYKSNVLLTILVLIVVSVLLSLGCWQVQRLHEKRETLKIIDQRMSQNMLIFPDDISSVENFDYSNGAVRGRFDYNHEFYVQPRRFMGDNGVHVITPFLRLNGNWILVNRGFSKKDDLPYLRRSDKSVIILNGILHKPDERNRFTPQNTVGDPYIYATDIKFIEQETGLAFSTPLVLYATDGKDSPPYGGQLRLDIPNNHLEYAFFWFTMAGMLLCFYAFFIMKTRKEKS